jgi:hypothetical protein
METGSHIKILKQYISLIFLNWLKINLLIVRLTKF